MIVLMAHEARSAQIIHVVVVGAVAPEQDPADVRVPESLVDPVGVVLGIGEEMVLTVLRGPFQRRFLECRRAEKQEQETQGGSSERAVRKQW
jgi:hypothetical protein